MRILFLFLFSHISSYLSLFVSTIFLLFLSFISVFGQPGQINNMAGFPAGSLVLLTNGQEKPIEEIRSGDILAAYDPVIESFIPTSVNEVEEITNQNSAVTTVMLVQEELTASLQVNGGILGIILATTEKQSVLTATGVKEIGQLLEGDKIYCYNETLHRFELFTVYAIENQENFTGKLYQLSTDQRNYIVNGAVVLNDK